MNNLEELKEIRDNAPYENMGENLFVNGAGDYILFYEDDFFNRFNNGWVKVEIVNMYAARSLDDIKLIIELMESKNE